MNDLLEYARRLADKLQGGLFWESGETPNTGWWATDAHSRGSSRALATEALEFLSQYAGPDSQWAKRAEIEISSFGAGQSLESGIHAIGEMLKAWAGQVDAGIIMVAGTNERQEFALASTDLMDQVQALSQDKATHPAAAIVLAGAALETALRATVVERSLPLADKPSIDAYAKALRSAKHISAQDMKDITSCAGLRNAAAHGEFDELSRERAGLMEQMVNVLLRRLADLHNVAE